MDDALLDGTQSVNIRANATGYASSTIALSVTDYETLAVSVAVPAISENGGATIGTVTRSNTDIATPLVVQLQSSDTTEASVPSSVTIAAGQSSATFTINAIDDQLQDGTQTATILARASGYIDGSQSIDIVDTVALSLTVTLSAISENGGTTTATVTRSDANVASPLTILLSSSDTTEATVPASVQIPAGQSSATFPITAVDDSILDGPQTVTLTVASAGYASAAKTLTILDFEELQLQIDAATISEAGGTTRGRVTRRNTDIASSIVVNLSSSDMSEAIVTATVTIPANQASVQFDITAIDDALLDGLQAVTITAASSGYQSASASLSVSDSEDLSIQFSDNSMSEHNGQITGTVRRSNNDTTQALTVTLASSDPTEATVPATIVIPIGSTTVNFVVPAVDDDLLDGTQSVTVQASAFGYTAGSSNLNVLDYETLSLSLGGTRMSEAGGKLTARVVRSNIDIASPLSVQLISSDIGEATVPPRVTIPANANGVDFEVTAVDDTLLDGLQLVALLASATGYMATPETQFQVDDYETLVLSIIGGSMSEEGGSLTARIARSNSDNQLPLVVQLNSQDTSEAAVPASIVIPAGQSSTEFTITAVDDDLLDGPQNVLITASEPNYIQGSASLTVTDLESLQLQLANNLMSEQGGVITATITRKNTNLELPLTVNLLSSDPSEATVPSTVTIPANQAQTTFTISAVDDQLLDGPQTVEVSVSADAYRTVKGSLDVTDAEALTLSINASAISEAGELTTAVLTRSNSDTALPLTVQLTSSDTSEANVPTSVVIPANQTSTTFQIQAVDDAILDGTQSITINAQATGYASGSSPLAVTDAESLLITLSRLAMSEQSDSIIATIARSNTNTALPLDVALILSDSSEAKVPSQVTIPANSNSVQVLIESVDDDLLDGSQLVTLDASAAGYTGHSSQFTVQDVEQLFLSVDKSSISEKSGLATATVTRSNSDLSNPVTVLLFSSDSTELSIPTQVTIPAGQASVAFAASAMDDSLLDGSQPVTITAQATGYANGSSQLTVTDAESLTITLSRSTMSEKEDSIFATITRSNTDTALPLDVALLISDNSEAKVISQVTIPANGQSVQVLIESIDDDLLDGSQLVALDASAAGYTGHSSQFVVLDVEQLSLSVDKSLISETSGLATATVTRSNSDLGSPLTVQLLSSDPTELSLPAQVTIPAGQASVEFAVRANDDSLLDGSQLVTVTVRGSGYERGFVDVIVTDNEALTIQLSATSITERGGQATASIARSNSDNQQALSVLLSVSDPSKASIPASVVIPAGSDSAQITVSAVDNRLVDGLKSIAIVATAVGYIDAVASINVEDDDRLFPWQNSRDPLDVNDSTQITPLDALLVINAINTRLVLTPNLPDPFDPVAYVDVNGDGLLTPIDALLVINYLNTKP